MVKVNPESLDLSCLRISLWLAFTRGGRDVAGVMLPGTRNYSAGSWRFANQVKPWLQFTGVSVGPNPGDMVPVLDTKLRVDHDVSGENVHNQYYEECSSRLVLMSQSAMATKLKI